jgi:hypothetical protein
VVDSSGPPVAGFFAWYDASAIAGLADGAAVASWSDGSGNGYTATQGTAGQRPAYYKTTAGNLINGLPTVKYTAASNQILSATVASISQPVTVCAVIKGTLSPANSAWFSVNATPILGFLASAGPLYKFGGGATVSGGVPTTAAHTVVCNCTTAGTSSVIRVDGTQVATGNAGTSSAGTTLSLGGWTGSATFAWDGLLAEIVFYGSSLVTTDMQSVEAYLKAKWATP